MYKSQFKKFLALTFVISLFTVLSSFGQRLNIDYSDNSTLNFNKIQAQVYDEWKKVGEDDIRGFKQFKRWEYFWLQRTYPSGNFPEGIDVFESYKSYEKKQNNNSLLLNVQWTPHGPFNEPTAASGQQGIGRVNSIRFNPNNQNEIWAGSASGGLWKSTNFGQSWSTFEFTQFLSIGVSDIGIAKSNPRIVYVATGDMFGSTSNRNFYSIGLIKTTDGGSTWNTTTLNHKLEERLLLGRVLVNPVNPNLVYVASNRGIYKSTDGGTTWRQFERSSHVMGMEFKPNDANVIYASTYSHTGGTGVYVSYDAGETWKRNLYISNAVRIALAVTPANPEKVYTLAANTVTFGFNSVYQSDNSGETFELKATTASLSRNILGWYTGNPNNDDRGQGFYDLCIAASPTVEDELYFGGINLWRTTDPGLESSYTKIAHWTPSQSLPYVHADQHVFAFAPDNTTLFVGNDGGIDATTNRGATWTSFSNGMNITQYYRIGVSQSQSNTVIAGAQDNGTALYKGNDKWNKVYSSDGMECIIDYSNPTRMYATTYNGNIFRSNNGGQSFAHILGTNTTQEEGDWVTPFVLNPMLSSTIYAGFRSVWKSENFGSSGSWKKISNFSPSSTLKSLAIAPSDTNVIYAASQNQLFATYNGGKDWQTIYTSNTYITYIAVDHINPRRVWVTKSGYNAYDKVLEIIDSTVVRNLSGNLPNVPVNTIVLQENSPDRLYIGTDIGVFVSDYNSAYWEKFGSDLPNVIIMELEIHKNDNKIFAATYGRGLWSAPLIGCNSAEVEIEVVPYDGFCPGDTITISAKKNYPNYTWSNGAKTKVIKVTKSGDYSLFVADQSGCISRSAAHSIPKSQNDVIEITKIEDEFLCPDEDLILYATSGFDTYQWSDGSTDRILIITEPGEYSVIGVNSEGCVIQSEPLFINFMPTPPTPTITQEGNKLIASYGTTYQWYHNNRRILGQTEREHIIVSGKIGDYTVAVFNEYGCSTLSEPLNIISSVENNIYNDFDVLVNNNPGDGNFNLEFTQPVLGSLTITITDISGRKVHSAESTFGSLANYTLDISHLSSGVYIARINANNLVKTIKLIKN